MPSITFIVCAVVYFHYALSRELFENTEEWTSERITAKVLGGITLLLFLYLARTEYK